MDSLELIITKRRSDRIFINSFPDKEIIDKIAESSVYAPYSRATGLPYQDIRKIYIFKQGTENYEEAKKLLNIEIARISKKVNLLVTVFPFLKKKYKTFADKFKGLSKTGISSLENVAYFIVIAERKGFPPVAGQSISHAMQNMWLSATAAGLGFQLIKETSLLADNKRFCKLLDIQPGKYQTDGCVIGITAKTETEPRSFDMSRFIKWM